MKQEYFVVVLAHSLRGRLRRIHIPHQAVYAILALALLGCFSVFGFVASYARMAWKVANYNALKREADALRTRYQNLQNVVNQTNQQLASLQLYAKEVSLAYGIKQKLEGPADIASEGKLVPTFAESVEDYDFLQAAPTCSRCRTGNPADSRLVGSKPSIWPVDGPPDAELLRHAHRSRSRVKARSTREWTSARHTARPVHVTADGIVVYARMGQRLRHGWCAWTTAAASRPTTRTSRRFSCTPGRPCGAASIVGAWAARAG